MADQLAWTPDQYLSVLALLAGIVAAGFTVSALRARHHDRAADEGDTFRESDYGRLDPQPLTPVPPCGLHWLLDVTVECTVGGPEGFHQCGEPGPHTEEHICPCGEWLGGEWLINERTDEVVPLLVADCGQMAALPADLFDTPPSAACVCPWPSGRYPDTFHLISCPANPAATPVQPALVPEAPAPTEPAAPLVTLFEPDCTCGICGKPTDTAPLCREHPSHERQTNV